MGRTESTEGGRQAGADSQEGGRRLAGGGLAQRAERGAGDKHRGVTQERQCLGTPPRPSYSSPASSGEHYEYSGLKWPREAKPLP